MENVLHLFGIVLVEHALQAAVLSKDHPALRALFGRGLLQVALQTLDPFYLLEGHAVLLAPLFILVHLVMAQLAGVVYFAAGSLHVACLYGSVQLRM